jgi:hypothetical protein
VRTAGDSALRIDEVLATRSLTPELWDRVRAGWSERIRLHPAVRAEFRRLYTGPPMLARNE